MHPLRAAVICLLSTLLLLTEIDPATAANRMLSLISWNIQVGSDGKFSGNNWSKRKIVLIAILTREEPDIIGLQEATSPQLQYLEKSLPSYDRVGVGRDDGKNAGEYCAILYNRTKFKLLNNGTFWLSDTPESSKNTWDGFYKRICTWAYLKDLKSDASFFIFNTHFPLNPFAQEKAAKLMVEKISSLAAEKVTFLVGDFNCTPKSKAWAIFKQAGFRDSELASGKKAHSNTYHFAGNGLACIDAIFVSKRISVLEHRILTDNEKGFYPSDHFGSLIRIGLPFKDGN